MAIDGCMRSKPISRFSRAALVSRVSVNGVSWALGASPRQVRS